MWQRRWNSRDCHDLNSSHVTFVFTGWVCKPQSIIGRTSKNFNYRAYYVIKNLTSSGNYMYVPPAEGRSNFIMPTQCIYVFRVIVTILIIERWFSMVDGQSCFVLKAATCFGFNLSHYHAIVRNIQRSLIKNFDFYY